MYSPSASSVIITFMYNMFVVLINDVGNDLKQIFREYKKLWVASLTSLMLSTQDRLDIERCENALDAFNIVLVRELAELEVEMASAASSNARSSRANAGQTRGWLALWKGTSVEKRVTQILSEEQKTELAKALEPAADLESDSEMPTDYVAMQLYVEFKHIALKLMDSYVQKRRLSSRRKSSGSGSVVGNITRWKELLTLTVIEVALSTAIMPIAESVKVALSVDSISVTGTASDDDGSQSGPTMLSTFTDLGSGRPYVDAMLELNPVDKSCSMRAVVYIQSMTIIFDAPTVAAIMEFAKAPSSAQAVQIQSAAFERLVEMRHQTKLGLRYALSRRKNFVFELDIRPIQIMLPYEGAANRQNSSMLLIVFGPFSIVTEKTHEGSNLSLTDIENMSFEELKQQMYDMFTIKLERIQLLYVKPGENWREAIAADASTMHILTPLTVALDVYKCIVTDTNLPNVRVNGELSSVRFRLSDECLIGLLELARSIKLPYTPDVSVNDMQQIRKKLVGRKRKRRRQHAGRQLVRVAKPKQKAKKIMTNYDATKLDFKFNVKVAGVVVEQKKGHRSLVPVLNIIMEDVGLDVIQRQLDSSTRLFCARFCLQHPQFQAGKEAAAWYSYDPYSQEYREGPLVNLVSVPRLLNDKLHAMIVEIKTVDRRHPNFGDMYDKTKQKMVVRLSSCYVLVHQEALLDVVNVIVAFIQDTGLLDQPDAAPSALPQKSTRTAGRTTVDRTATVKRRKKKAADSQGEKSMSVTATMDRINVALCSNDKLVTSLTVADLDATVTTMDTSFQLRSSLRDMAIYAYLPDCPYTKILSFTEEFVFRLAFVAENRDFDEVDYMDSKNVHYFISLYSGSLTVVFVNKYIRQLQKFVGKFVDEMRAVMPPTTDDDDDDDGADDEEDDDDESEAGGTVSNIVELMSKRFAMDIMMKLPILVLPVSSKSTRAVVLDLGALSVANELRIVSGVFNEERMPAVVDWTVLHWNNVNIARAEMTGSAIKSKCYILESMTLDLTAVRNLSSSWYQERPLATVSVDLPLVSLMLSQGDYWCIISVLHDNVKEDIHEFKPRPKPPPPVVVMTEVINKRLSVVTPIKLSIAAVDTTTRAQSVLVYADEVRGTIARTVTFQSQKSIADDTPQSDIGDALSIVPVITIRVGVVVESVSVSLYWGSDELAVGLVARDEMKSLANIQVSQLAVDAELKSDNNVRAAAHIKTCTITDCRVGKRDGLTHGRMFETRQRGTYWIKASFSQNVHLSKVGALTVSGTHLTACPEFLVTVLQFFTKGLPKDLEVPVQPEFEMDLFDGEDLAVEGTSDEAAMAAPSSKMKITVIVEGTELAFVDDLLRTVPVAVILKFEAAFHMLVLPEQQSLSGLINEVSVYTCVFTPDKMLTSRVPMIESVWIRVESVAPSGANHRITVTISDIVIVVSSSAMHRILAITDTLARSAEEIAEAEIMSIPSNLWLPMPVEDLHLWFLNPVYTKSKSVTNDTIKTVRRESLIDRDDVISIRTISQPTPGDCLVLAECNVLLRVVNSDGRRVVPLISTQLSLKDLIVSDWSKKFYAKCTMTLESAYFNERVALWEPLIEPVEQKGSDVHRPWQVVLEAVQNELIVSGSTKTSKLFTTRPPEMSISIVSSDVFQVTVSTVTLQVIDNITGLFERQTGPVDARQRILTESAPFVIMNDTGDLVLQVVFGEFYQSQTTLAVRGREDVGAGQMFRLYRSPPTSVGVTDAQAAPDYKRLAVSIKNSGDEREIDMYAANVKWMFTMKQGSASDETVDVVAHVETIHGYRLVTLRSSVQVTNNLAFTVEVYYETENEDKKPCGVVESRDSFNLPSTVASYEPFTVYFRPQINGIGMSASGYKWLTDNILGSVVMMCPGDDNDLPDVFFTIKTTVENILYESTNESSSKLYNIGIYPSLVFRNLLPYAVTCTLLYVNADVIEVKAGHHEIIYFGAPGKCNMEIEMNYLGLVWIGNLELDQEPNEFGVVTLAPDDEQQKMTLDLGVHCDWRRGYLVVSLYCPYWMINKTDYDLAYRSSKDYVVYHYRDHGDIILFSGYTNVAARRRPGGKGDGPGRVSIVDTRASFSNAAAKEKPDKNKAKPQLALHAEVKIENSVWSKKFALDAVGTNGIVKCGIKGLLTHGQVTRCQSNRGDMLRRKLLLGVNIRLANSGLTSIVTFKPVFMLVNEAQFTIYAREHVKNAPLYVVDAGRHVTFWPQQTGRRRLMTACIGHLPGETKPFDFATCHSTLLHIDNRYGGILVHCVVHENYIRVIFRQYSPGAAPVLLVNHTRSTVSYWQAGVLETRHLPGGKAIYYTWQDPLRGRTFFWSTVEHFQHINKLRQDGFGKCRSILSDKNTLYWVSMFCNGQRILFFTNDRILATTVFKVGRKERVKMDVLISVQGFGFSLVNNEWRKEIIYAGVTSSPVVWEGQDKKKRFRPLSSKLNSHLEDCYSQYLVNLRTNHDARKSRVLQEELNFDVNYSSEPMMMLRPFKKIIRRHFQPAIWLRFRTSSHQTQLHLKIHHFQVDNQLIGTEFPTVLAPYDTHVSGIKSPISKPFVEISVMIIRSDYSETVHFRYVQLLIQELMFRVDVGFLLSLLAAFKSKQVGGLDSSAAEFDYSLRQFVHDCELAKVSLMTEAKMSRLRLQAHLYDYIHLSPIKVHMSFSLAGDNAMLYDGSWIVSVLMFLKSFGILLTDFDDVLFRLNYFERRNMYVNNTELVSVVVNHYIQQVLRHIYSLLLGLSLFGNPMAVLENFVKGIRDLFYEPYKGAVLGPEEFVLGLGLGVKNFLGYTVGGVTGAGFKMTASLGKGLAALSLNKEFYRKRQQSFARPAETVGEGFARAARRLVMGIAHGLKGIITQPVIGARQGGFRGFMAGVGKGLIGAIVLPFGGVVDFGAHAFEGVHRQTLGVATVHRLRPARLIQADGVIWPYVYLDAVGNVILQETSDGAFADDSYLGHLVLSDEDREILVVTDVRMMYTNTGKVFRERVCEWFYSWTQLYEFPTLAERGIEIVLKESPGSPSRLIIIRQKYRDKAERFLAKMRPLVLIG